MPPRATMQPGSVSSLWTAISTAMAPSIVKRGPRTLPSRMRIAVVSNNCAAVSTWLNEHNAAAVDVRHAGLGETMLMLAASRGLGEIVSVMLNAGADINLKTAEAVNGRQMSPLMLAAASGHEGVVRQLLDAGAHVDGVADIVDEAHADGVLSDTQHRQMRTCCSCCPANCLCCARACQCCNHA